MRRRKGQSATEYLMTYGWALLAIAIVGALLYMYVFSNKKCMPAVHGMDGETIKVVPNKYQVYTDGTIKMVLQNNLGENATITKIVIEDDKGNVVSTCTDSRELYPGETIQVGSGGVICTTLQAPPGNEGDCKSLGVKIQYDTADLTGIYSTGKIIAKYVAPA